MRMHRSLMVMGLSSLLAIAITSDAADFSNEPILPIPLSMALDAGKVKLGERLFNEPRL